MGRLHNKYHTKEQAIKAAPAYAIARFGLSARTKIELAFGISWDNCDNIFSVNVISYSLVGKVPVAGV